MTATAVRADPVNVAAWAFAHDHWWTPSAILRAMDRPHAKVAVKACHSSSKTFTAADVVLVALLNGHDVVTTAPTQEQVERLLWGHIRRAIDGSPKIARAAWGNVNLTEIRMPTGEFAVGIATKPEEGGVRFQGHHARPGSALDVVIDEAIGVNPGIFEAVEGFSAGGDVRRLYLCNPTVPSGPVYDIFEGDDPTWERVTIDAFDTPNLEGLTLSALLAMDEHELDDNVRPYLVTRRWVRDMYHLWGEDNPLWQSRVRGQFPGQASNSLIARAWIDAAAARPGVWSERGGDVTAGVDVAGPGKDETVVYVRQGPRVLECRAYPDPDARGKVLAGLQSWLHKGLKRVNVDSAGDGHYFTLHLRDHLPQAVEVNGINVGESATDTPNKHGRLATDEFANLKAELYWHLREQFRDGMVSGLTDRTTQSQLASLQWAPNDRGKTAIERKEAAAKRGVKSPDRAEALMLCFAPTLADQLLAKAWSGQAERTLSPQEARLPWNQANGGQQPEQGGWLTGVRWE